jgi:HEAT repeat protein
MIAENTPAAGFTALATAPAAHRRVIGSLLLRPLAVTGGEVVGPLREVAARLGLTDLWLADLQSRVWWSRAYAARAIGLIGESRGFESLIGALEDDHEEVRAAAVEGLGHLGDPQAITPLLRALSDSARFQRARVVEALGRLGLSVAPLLLEYVRQEPDDAVLAAEVLGMIGGAEAVGGLTAWAAADDPHLRAAAIGSLGAIGLDERTFYFALRALADPDPTVRAQAAQALGRTSREDAVPYLAPCLDDEWQVAAHAARALRGLGAAGITCLEARAQAEGLPGDLARQMLWEQRMLGHGPS